MRKKRKARRSTRLKDWDYSSPGCYYVTICIQKHRLILGQIETPRVGTDSDSRVRVAQCGDPQDRESNPPQRVLNEAGKMVEKWWLKLPERFEHVSLDEYQIMPNHLHGIIIIGSVHGRSHRTAPTRREALGDLIRWFKTMSTNKYIHNVKNKGWPRFEKRLWQRNYYEHIIRNEKDLMEKRTYMRKNPYTWADDENNPINISI